MTTTNEFIQHNIGIILLLSAILGLFIPDTGIDTSQVIIPALGTIIFVSYFRVSFNRNLVTSDLISILIFIIVRFILLPVTLFVLLSGVSSFYAIALFLLLLLPSAVSSPAFTTIFNGNAGLSLKILVFTSFIAIFSIPFLSHLVLQRNIQIDRGHMFQIMLYTIAVPFLIHLPFRKFERFKERVTQNSPLITVVGLALIFIVSTSRNREIILSNPLKMTIYVFIATAIYFALYIGGYYLLFFKDKPGRIAYSVCSGANNIGIGVSITLLFFPGEINVFFIISQLSWIFVLIPMRYFYRNQQKSELTE